MCETRIFMHTFNLNSISQMKKKIFSALLMGVFTLASMSMFVSCKDYDDDINNLDAGQQELLSRLEALEGDVNTKYTDLSGQLATAVENANKALQGVENANALINEVKGTAAAAGEAAAAAQTTADGAQDAAEAAQKTADEALEAAKKALEAAGADESGKQALEKIAALETRVASLEALKETIPTLIEQAQKATNEQLKALNEQVAKYEAFFDNLFAMLTSVELYGTYNGTAADLNAKPANLNLLWGKVVDDSKFGDNEASTGATENPVTFAKGTDIKANDGVIVRVNPVNAQITGDNVAIKVINSKGEDMSKYIEVAGVEPYDELITTRAGKINSGLYKIKFQIADDFDNDAFKAATTAKVSGAVKQILFAVAINNTDTLQEDRYVASTFDLTLTSEKYQNLSRLDYIVTGTNNDPMAVANIHNRWNGKDATDDAGVSANGSGAKEYVWAKSTKQNPTPASVATDDNTVVTGDVNAYDPSFKDARCFIKKYVPVSFGVPFTVELTDAVAAKAAYYYVVLDKDFITDSDDSEQAAWFGDYSYVGLNKVTPADEKLSITVTAKNAKSDKIGFRVFAVNLDGTLIDPDGRAFYVSVGDDAAVAEVDAEIKVWLNGKKNNSVIVPLPSTFKAVATTKATNGTATGKDYFSDADLLEMMSGAGIDWQLCKDDKGTTVTNWKDAKYIKITFDDAKNFLNGATFSFTINAQSDETNVDRIVNALTVNVTKVMPTVADQSFKFKPEQLVNGVYTCYLDPQQQKGANDMFTWTSVTTTGYKNLWNFVTGMDDDNYTWTFADAAWDNKSQNKKKAYTKMSDKDGNLLIEIANVADFIDGTTPHATTIYYDFDGINCISINGTLVNDNPLTSKTSAAYTIPVEECQTVFACPIDLTTYTLGQAPTDKKDANGKPIYADCNFIYYAADYPAWFTSNDGTTANGPQALTRYIKATNSVDPDLYTFDRKWNIELYQTGSVKAYLYTQGTKDQDYFTVEVTPYGNLVFHKVSGATNPNADVPSTLTLTAKDAFGHERTIAEFPFTVKRVTE